MSQIRATGETRSDMLAKAGIYVSKSAPPSPPNTDSPAVSAAKVPEQVLPTAAQADTNQAKPTVDVSELDVIDRIIAESVRPEGTAGKAQAPHSAASFEAQAEAEAAAVAQLEKLLARLPIER